MKQELEVQKGDERRKFVAQPLPDYEKMALDVMPSSRPTTVAMKPVFASDSLPKKQPKAVSPPKRDFVV